MSLDDKPTGIDWAGPHHGMARFGEDRNLLVMFYNRSCPIPGSGGVHGKPVHRNEIYIKIMQPGEMLNVIDRPVKDEDKIRFRDKWAAFIHDRTQIPDGVPIDLLFPNHPAVADNLRGFGVYTIEQCAQLSAHAIDTVGRGAQEYVTRAKRYLDMSEKGAEFHQLQSENEQLKTDVRVLEQKLEMALVQLKTVSDRVNDPVRGSFNPGGFISNYDVQAERINSNSVSSETARDHNRSKRARPVSRKQDPIESAITDPFESPSANPTAADSSDFSS